MATSSRTATFNHGGMGMHACAANRKRTRHRPQPMAAISRLASISSQMRGKTPGSEVLLGDALVLGSGVLLGVIQVYSKFLVRSINAFQVIVWELIYGTPLYFILSFIFERQLRVQLTSAVVAAVLYQGLVVAAFCFVTWTNLLRRYSASKMTAFHFTTPIFGVLLSRLILGENILPGLAAGVALVAIGIYVVSRPEGTNRQ
ncbi:MAG: DMT family transporter [Armatimonadetes bacterium]|nr:DMT family transporter [Armatimonadota bacterium]